METNNQTAVITVSYDGGAPSQILKWDSLATSPTFHPDSQNETVIIPLNNPAGASNVVINFGLTDAGNDWWWALDNISVDAGVAPPTITTQPEGRVASVGATITMSVNVTGEALQYEWRHDGTPLPGQTSAQLSLGNVTAGDAGNYDVVVSNAGGSVTSAPALLVVLPVSPITQDLVAHLKFDNNLNDSSGRGNHGTPVGTISYVAGKVGATALRHSSAADGSSFNYVTLGTPADLNFGASTDFSISFWTTFTNFAGDPAFVSNKDWDSGDNQGYVIATGGNGRLQWNLAGPPGGRKDYDGDGGTLNNGSWHHVVVTFDRDGNAITYLDGAQVEATSLTANQNNLDTPAGLATNIGQDGAGDYTDGNSVGIMDGTIDDVGIWRRLVTAQEVSAIFTAGQAGNDLSTAVVGPPGLGALGAVRSDGNLNFTWSGGAGVRLQKATTLSSPNWVDVPGTEGNSAASEAIGNGNAYYRLFRP
jgi:hypothetical protein